MGAGIGTLGSSVIRTLVPIAVGALLTWLLSFGIEFDPETQTQIIAAALLLITALVQAVYYVLCRLVEQKFPQFGILLGLPRTPDSYSPDVPAADVAATPSTDPYVEYFANGASGKPTTMYLTAMAAAEPDETPRPGHRPKHALRGDADVPGFPTPADLDAVNKERGL